MTSIAQSDPRRKKQRAIDILNNEIVWYGGLLCTRYEVYQDVLKVTGSWKAADAWAYGWSVKAKPEDITAEMLAWSQQFKEQEKIA